MLLENAGLNLSNANSFDHTPYQFVIYQRIDTKLLIQSNPTGLMNYCHNY